jgi:hypothetical protein
MAQRSESSPANRHAHVFEKINLLSWSVWAFLLPAFLLPSFAGCLSTESKTKSATSTVLSGTASTPSGAKAVKIIFKPVSQGGSFDAAPSSGTTNAAGSGVQVTQLYNPDGTTLATGTTSASWPKWLTSFEIGISGSANGNAKNPYCARFATSGLTSSDDTMAQCEFKTGFLSNCGAPGGYYRVSDFDCYNSTSATEQGIGTGADTDGVYLRGIFNRDTSYLGKYENILAVLEYSASGLNPAPKDPSSCFSSGSASVESCADMTWKIYLKHTTSESLQSFLLLVPPTFASVDTTNGTGGSGISTRQFILPLAGDSSLSVLQISRTGLSSTLSSDPNFQTICAPNGTSDPANSALCVGMVFYSLTLYRI